MKKLAAFFLVLFILAIFSFGVVRYFANSSQQDNWFNANYRETFARSPFLRGIFHLRYDGDAKSDYFDVKKFPHLRIIVDRYEGCAVPLDVMTIVGSEIQRITGRSEAVQFVQNNTFTAMQGSYSKIDIRKLAQQMEKVHSHGDTAIAYLLCLNTYSDQPTNIGSTVNDDGMVVFFQTIKGISVEAPNNETPYLISTILHEFGHQLGLDHVQNDECIMATSAEVPGSSPADSVIIPSRYCPAELDTAAEIAKRFTS